MTEPSAPDRRDSVALDGASSSEVDAGTPPATAAKRRRKRQRVGRPPWVRLWLYLSEGPPAELVQSLVEMWRPVETFSNSRGPWHRGVVVSRERRFRRRKTPVERYFRYGAPADLAKLTISKFRRHPIALSLSVAAMVWWFWPWIRPPVSPVTGSQDNRPFVVGVDGMTPRRVSAAISAWRAMPGALLVVMDLGSVQSYAVLNRAGLTAEEMTRLKLISTCGDTVTLSADMANHLRRIKGAPGQLVVVTSPDTLDRLKAVMQVMLGGDGWRIEGVPSEGAENPPESILRRWRDELRAQFWRATGVSGRDAFVCRARGKGLI
mgnify:CR=1 FL=1